MTLIPSYGIIYPFILHFNTTIYIYIYIYTSGLGGLFGETATRYAPELLNYAFSIVLAHCGFYFSKIIFKFR